MAITVIGTGFVGVVTSAVFAKFGNKVIGLDIDKEKISRLNDGEVPFYEPNLTKLVRESIKAGRLRYTADYKEAVEDAEVIMISVGTPSAPDGTADIQYVVAAVESLAVHLKEDAIVAVKSTVPPGTNKILKEIIDRKTKKRYALVSLPEFLREGSAVHDTLEPDRVVIGAREKWAIEKLIELHKPFKGELVVISPESAQMAKYTANAYLAQRITFINQIANLCEKNGADINEIIEAISYDKRVGGHYWYPGLGYGGSCFPKDVKELAAYSRSVGEGDGLFVKIDELNSKRIVKKLTSFEDTVGGFKDKTVAVLGLSFKPNTNDLREAPSLQVIPFLQSKGARVKAYDPQAMENGARKVFKGVDFADDVYDCANDADVLMLLIEWDEFLSLEMAEIAKAMNKPAWFIDTRNQYLRRTVERAGINYLGIGN